MRKISLAIILFLPVFNAAVFGLLRPVDTVEKPTPTTVSEIVANPLLWVGKKVRVRGFFSVSPRLFPLPHPPFNCILVEPRTRAQIGVNYEHAFMLFSFIQRCWGWEHGDVGPSTVIGVVRVEIAWVGRFWIDAETVVKGFGAGRRSAMDIAR